MRRGFGGWGGLWGRFVCPVCGVAGAGGVWVGGGVGGGLKGGGNWGAGGGRVLLGGVALPAIQNGGGGRGAFESAGDRHASGAEAAEVAAREAFERAEGRAGGTA